MADEDGFERLDERLDQSGRVTAVFEAELARLQQAMNRTGREATSLTAGFGGGLRRAFEGVVFDGMKLSDALKGIAQSMADTVFSVAMRPVQQAVAGALAQGVGNLMGGAMPFAAGGPSCRGG